MLEDLEYFDLARLLREQAEATAETQRNAERWRKLRARLYGFDADWCEDGLGVVFKFPASSRVGVGQALDDAVDALPPPPQP